MKRRILAVILMLTLTISMLVLPAGARDLGCAETAAQCLKELGLFRGVSETNFDLERAPSRLEALVMLIRVLGQEQQALRGVWTHPFTDVPAWADPYVGFAYENGLTNGISASLFGTQDANAAAYLTFTLRALGYSDENGQDFTWDNPFSLARRVGILPECVDLETFWRADAAMISYAALPVYLEDGSQTLAEKLTGAGCFTQEAYDAVYCADLLAEASAAVPEEPETQETETEDAPLIASENFHGKYYTGGPSSKCYHYEADCAGKYSHEISREQAARLSPCGTCVLH